MAQKRILARVALLLITLTCVSLRAGRSPESSQAQHGRRSGAGQCDRNRIRTKSSVRGLDKKDFQVWEDKVEQKIAYFSSEDVPVSVGIIFDVSGSMKDKIANAQRAAATFFKSGTKRRRIF